MSALDPLSNFPESGDRMPVLFMGHGSPMNAIEENGFTEGWRQMVRDIPRPKAILIISAHWETVNATRVFAGVKPRMIYDMYGFPRNLYQVEYPSPGSPELAGSISERIKDIAPTHEWGLDHGAWSVLVKMYPDATIPCFQVSLNTTRDLQRHYDLGRQLSFLRRRGVLIMGSGNMVHNLREFRYMDQPPTDWAIEFDQVAARLISEGDHKSLIRYRDLGPAAEISVNSAEHFIPLLYALALQEKDEPVAFTNHDVEESLMGKWMRCVRIG